MKTVLVFTWFYHPLIGGAELFVRAIAERLRHRFHFVIVTARLDKKLKGQEREDGIKVFRVGAGYRADKFIYPIAALHKALQLESADLVHTIMVNASAVASYFYLRLRTLPSLLTLQEGDSEEYVRDYLGPLFPIYPRLHRPFDRIHAISSFLRDEAVRHGAAPERIDIIPNGVDLESFNPSASNPQELDALRDRLDLKDKRIIVSVSRLATKNALDDLLRAMPAIVERQPNAALLLVGDGHESTRLRALANELGIRDKVRFTGAVEHQETVKYLRLAEVFVRPSISEGLGSAFLEAMATGTPVIGTPVGGIVDFLRDGETGLYCQPQRPESIVNSVDRLLSDRALSQRLVRQGQELVRRDYDWDRIAEGIGRIYQELLAK